MEKDERFLLLNDAAQEISKLRKKYSQYHFMEGVCEALAIAEQRVTEEISKFKPVRDLPGNG
jgi:ATP-dependent phosphoenolpyruvate carboxykinase